jgi:hypothetical protein
VKKKIQAITECFITSSIPPELQVDVPIEMAEKLMERITSRNQNIGPYLFREVQVCQFYFFVEICRGCYPAIFSDIYCNLTSKFTVLWYSNCPVTHT